MTTTVTDGGLGTVVLDRPAALNALDAGMIRTIHDALTAWISDDSVAAVLISSSSPRAFCAGGDLKPIRDAVLGGRVDDGVRFFADEYALNYAIAQFPKPYVAILDGIAMGGGLGLSVHGSVRIVTERSVLAMPETGIGFVPDVGSSYFLSRLPGSMGRYLALTGTQLTAGDAVGLGLATHFVPSERIPTLTAALARDGADAADVVERYAEPAPAGDLEEFRDSIDTVFGGGSLLDVVDALSASDPFSRDTRAKMLTLSPTSLMATDELIRRGRDGDLRRCLATELTVAGHIIEHPDFAEGVRAVLVDKDKAPRWTPLALEMVSQRRIEDLFS